MITEHLNQILSKYDQSKIRIGVLGSHSALEIASGAKQEGFETVVVVQKGRDKTYTKYYKNVFDHVIALDKFSDITSPNAVKQLTDLNTVFVPNRSFSVYAGYEPVEDQFAVPLMGNRSMLRTEERNTPRNQLYLLQQAGIKTPKTFNSPEEIDRLAIIKVPEKTRSIERAFFYASNPQEYEKVAEKRIEQGIITREALGQAVIEEYVLGAKFNANLFWSPLTDDIDLLGFDRRIQTDLDGVLDLPAQEQMELNIPTQNIEIGHMGATMRESQIEKIFEAAEKFVSACKKEYPPGMIGLFALQGAVTKDLDFYVFDVSPRVPGCPCVEATSPYMKYKYGIEVGPGRRVAMEIKAAVKAGRLADVVT
ncbi:MAG: formate--phosphoribosylaminoimidazolecarboxamide ligase family protein [Candidatus Bathyarchaeota archaeon]|nr:formate--phosphoribosylaminoimidazolecarboxamide ligase family protein [Candidatus Bathyarchaeota archaeon]